MSQRRACNLRLMGGKHMRCATARLPVQGLNCGALRMRIKGGHEIEVVVHESGYE